MNKELSDTLSDVDSELIEDILSNRLILNRDSALREINDPGDWNHTSSRGDWRIYVPCEIREKWNQLSITPKVCVYFMAMRQLEWGDD